MCKYSQTPYEFHRISISAGKGPASIFLNSFAGNFDAKPGLKITTVVVAAVCQRK